jgi:tetratricopeptide (TPR) repeat protein
MKQTILVLPMFAAIGVLAAAQETPVAPSPDKERIRELSERAQKAESKGDRTEALRAYEELLSRPITGVDTDAEIVHARVAATFQAGRNLEAIAMSDAAPAARLAAARGRYEEVIAEGDSSQKLAARNALGVLLLRQGLKADALATLMRMDLSMVSPKQAFVFHSNLGRAYEENGQLEPALAEYKAALEQQPSFTPAQDGAFRVLRGRTPPAAAEAIALIELLATKGEVRAAADRTRKLLVAWGGPAAAELLPQLVGKYAAARLTPPDFATREWPDLAKVTDAVLRLPLEQLRRAYQDDITVSGETWRAPTQFSAWAEPRSRARSMAALLRFLGDLEDGAARPRGALARYWTAWLLEREPDYAVATLSVLEAHPELQAEPPRVIDRLIQTLFETKGDAYSRQDWPSIVRLHVILAGIFEKQGRWGPEGGAESALFQWEHAASASSRARREHPEMGPSPGIHLSLAACYRRLNRLPGAWHEYVEAAEGFLADDRPADAKNALVESTSLDWRPSSAADQDRLKKLEAAIDAR